MFENVKNSKSSPSREDVLLSIVGDRGSDARHRHVLAENNLPWFPGVNTYMYIDRNQGKAILDFLLDNFDGRWFRRLDLSFPLSEVSGRIMQFFGNTHGSIDTGADHTFNNFALVSAKTDNYDIGYLLVHPYSRRGSVANILFDTESYFNHHGLFADKATDYSIRSADSLVRHVVTRKGVDVLDIKPLFIDDRRVATGFSVSRDGRSLINFQDRHTGAVEFLPVKDIDVKLYAAIVPSLRNMAFANADVLSINDYDRQCHRQYNTAPKVKREKPLVSGKKR